MIVITSQRNKKEETVGKKAVSVWNIRSTEEGAKRELTGRKLSSCLLYLGALPALDFVDDHASDGDGGGDDGLVDVLEREGARTEVGCESVDDAFGRLLGVRTGHGWEGGGGDGGDRGVFEFI